MAERAAAGASQDAGEGGVARDLRRLLAVGLEPELYARIEALLNRSYFEVDKVPRGESGRVLCAAIPFDLVMIRYPLPDIDVSDLLSAMRLPVSPCAHSQVVLLADEARLFQAQRLVGQGADAALATDRTGDLMSELASRLLHVAPRIATRIMVHLQAQISTGDGQVFCQTVDLSTSGMFVRTDASYPIGTAMTFHLLLPEAREAVVGTAEVVREAAASQGRLEGIGLRYVDFRAGSEARLRSYLERTGAGG